MVSAERGMRLREQCSAVTKPEPGRDGLEVDPGLDGVRYKEVAERVVQINRQPQPPSAAGGWGCRFICTTRSATSLYRTPSRPGSTSRPSRPGSGLVTAEHCSRSRMPLSALTIH